MDKVVATPKAAVADIPEGATIAIAGFSVGHRFASSLIIALRDQGTKGLTVVCNSLGGPGEIRGQILAENKQVKKLIAAFSVRPGLNTASEAQINSGEMEVELVPQGTLVERCRAGGSGIPAFYTPTSVGTLLTEGKEVRDFDGKKYVLERGITGDFALVKAWKGDRHGNLVFRESSRNFNPLCASAGRVTIAEVEEIVEPGALDPDHVHTQGIFVQRVFRGTNYQKRIERRTVSKG
jgi:3-oxoacid CoA-transferase subunit A